MDKRQIMQWDANVHEDILICMFQHLKLNNEDWTSVMAELQKLGYTFTESALRQHVQKLRKNRDTNASNALTAIQTAGTGSATTTPRKKATPRKRKNAKNTPAEDDDAEDEKMKLKQENDDEGGDELVSPSPMKRARRTPKPEPKEKEVEAEVEGEI